MDLVVLHGRAAAGKLTTARALGGQLRWPVFTITWSLTCCSSVFEFGSPPFVRLREQMWLSVFSELAAAGTSLIFTFTPEPTVPPGFPLRVNHMVESSGGRVCWVQLEISDDVQERRIDAADRREFHKLTDLATLRRRRSEPDGETPPGRHVKPCAIR